MKNVSELSDTDLVLLVNALEGVMYNTTRFERKGYIHQTAAEKDTAVLNTHRDQAVAELKTRTGLNDFNELRKYVKNKLEEFNWLEEKNKKEIWRPGAIIVPREYNGEGYPKFILETIECYTKDPEDGRVAFARDREHKRFSPLSESRMGYFKSWRSIEPIWQESEPFERGLILKEEMKRYQPGKNECKWWNNDIFAGDVFYHEGLEEHVEYYERYYKNGKPIVLVRLHETPSFAELSEADAEVIHRSTISPKFHDRKGRSATIHLPYHLE